MHIFLEKPVDIDHDTQSYAVAKYFLMTSENNDLKNLHIVFCGILEKNTVGLIFLLTHV